MNYTVSWVPAAERELTRIWLEAPDRNAVTEAAHEIDSQLRINAVSIGESREEDRRILIVPPLAIKFRALSDDRVVQVLDVWKFEVS